MKSDGLPKVGKVEESKKQQDSNSAAITDHYLQYISNNQKYFEDDQEARDNEIDSKVLGSLGLDGGGDSKKQ